MATPLKTKSEIERLPPQSIDAEMAVLGAMLLEKEAIGKAIEIFGSEDVFYVGSHKKIYSAIVYLYERSEAVDLVTITEELRRRRELEDIGGAVYLTSLLDSVTTAAHIDYHAKIVLEKSILRKLISVGTQIVSDSYDAIDEVENLLDKAEQMVFNIKEHRLRQGLIPIEAIVGDTYSYIEALSERKGHITGLETGFKKLDTLTAGFQKADFVVVAGRPMMGKTAFALNVVEFAAVKYGVPVAVFSLEMSKNQLVQRMLSARARVAGNKLRSGSLDKNDWPRLAEAAGSLANSPVYIDDTAKVSYLEIRAKARRLKAEVQELGLVVIDYLQLVEGPKNAENRQQEISVVSRSLKALAKELDIPVMALSQLSRDVERRGGERRPVLSDLRESGAIEQDADVVIFIHRPEMYDRESEKGKAEIIIGKQRNGPTDSFYLAFIPEYTRFENLEEYREE